MLLSCHRYLLLSHKAVLRLVSKMTKEHKSSKSRHRSHSDESSSDCSSRNSYEKDRDRKRRRHHHSKHKKHKDKKSSHRKRHKKDRRRNSFSSSSSSSNDASYESKNKSIQSSSRLTESSHNTRSERIPNETLQNSNPIQELMSQLFDAVSILISTDDSSFAQDLDSMIHLILDGECICLEGITSVQLRNIVETLFLTLGLVLTEMEEEEEEPENAAKQQQQQHQPFNPRLGYALPDNSDTSSTVQAAPGNLLIVSECCRDRYLKPCSTVSINPTISTVNSNVTSTENPIQKKRLVGPSRPDQSHTESRENAAAHTTLDVPRVEEEIEEEDAMVGPFIPWTEEGIRRMKNNKSVQPIPTMTSINNKSNPGVKQSSTGILQREEWMTESKDHSFLNDIMGSLKNRSFQNEKASRASHPRPPSAPEPMMHPKIQQEINHIKQSYSNSRGPSLMEMHQERKKNAALEKQQQQQSQGGGGEWKWNREKDLEKGRTIDKEYLKMVMGGATSDLKTKFQGDFSKSFT